MPIKKSGYPDFYIHLNKRSVTRLAPPAVRVHLATGFIAPFYRVDKVFRGEYCFFIYIFTIDLYVA